MIGGYDAGYRIRRRGEEYIFEHGDAAVDPKRALVSFIRARNYAKAFSFLKSFDDCTDTLLELCKESVDDDQTVLSSLLSIADPEILSFLIDQAITDFSFLHEMLMIKLPVKGSIIHQLVRLNCTEILPKICECYLGKEEEWNALVTAEDDSGLTAFDLSLQLGSKALLSQFLRLQSINSDPSEWLQKIFKKNPVLLRQCLLKKDDMGMPLFHNVLNSRSRCTLKLIIDMYQDETDVLGRLMNLRDTSGATYLNYISMLQDVDGLQAIFSIKDEALLCSALIGIKDQATPLLERLLTSKNPAMINTLKALCIKRPSLFSDLLLFKSNHKNVLVQFILDTWDTTLLMSAIKVSKDYPQVGHELCREKSKRELGLFLEGAIRKDRSLVEHVIELMINDAQNASEMIKNQDETLTRLLSFLFLLNQEEKIIQLLKQVEDRDGLRNKLCKYIVKTAADTGKWAMFEHIKESLVASEINNRDKMIAVMDSVKSEFVLWTTLNRTLDQGSYEFFSGAHITTGIAWMKSAIMHFIKTELPQFDDVATTQRLALFLEQIHQRFQLSVTIHQLFNPRIRSDIIRRVSAGETVLISGGTREHNITFVIKSGRLVICNKGKGAESASSSSKVQDLIEREIPTDEHGLSDVLEQLLDLMSDSSEIGERRAIQHFYASVGHPVSDSLLEEITQSAQRLETCFFESPQAAFLAMLISDLSQLESEIPGSLMTFGRYFKLSREALSAGDLDTLTLSVGRAIYSAYRESIKTKAHDQFMLQIQASKAVGVDVSAMVRKMIYSATVVGDISTVKKWLPLEPTPSFKDRKGQTLFDIATKKGFVDIQRLLAEKL